MSEDRYIRINFIDKSQMTFTFTQQVATEFIAGVTKSILSSPQLLINTEERFYIFPWSSIKYIEGIPVPPVEIHNAITGAELVSQD